MARIRTPDESPEAGWHAHFREGQVPANVDDWKRCSTENMGCFHLVRNCESFAHGPDGGPEDPTSIREYLFYDFDEGQTPTVGQRLPIAPPVTKRSGLIGIGRFDLEHVAGPSCQNIGGYNGNNISLEEMRGCQTVQVLLPKGKSWQSWPDDLEVEATSKFYLTGIANCKGLVLHPLVRCLQASPARHGSGSVYLDLSADVCSFFCFSPKNQSKELI